MLKGINQSPCSLVLHEVGTLFEELRGLSEEGPTHGARGQALLPVPQLVPFEQSSGEAEQTEECSEEQKIDSH